MICSFNFLIFLAVCLNIFTVINIKILTNSNQQTQSYKFTSHIAAFLSVVLITEMLEICIQTSYDQNVQLILKSYLPVVYGTPLNLYLVTTSLLWPCSLGRSQVWLYILAHVYVVHTLENKKNAKLWSNTIFQRISWLSSLS